MDKKELKEVLKEFYRKAWQDHLCGMFRRDEMAEEYADKILAPPSIPFEMKDVFKDGKCLVCGGPAELAPGIGWYCLNKECNQGKI